MKIIKKSSFLGCLAVLALLVFCVERANAGIISVDREAPIFNTPDVVTIEGTIEVAQHEGELSESDFLDYSLILTGPSGTGSLTLDLSNSEVIFSGDATVTASEAGLEIDPGGGFFSITTFGGFAGDGSEYRIQGGTDEFIDFGNLLGEVLFDPGSSIFLPKATPTPEPSSLMLLVAGIGLMVSRRRR